MKKIVLTPFIYKEKQHISLRFERDVDVQELLKSHFDDLRWSMTHKVWHVPFDAKFTQEIFQLLKGKAYVDYSAMKLIENSTVLVEKKTQNSVLPPLDAAKQQSVEVYIRYLKSKRYSENTIKTYSEAIQLFLRYFHSKSIEEISNEDIIAFNNDYILANNYSSSYQNQFVNAVKLFFAKIQNKQLNPELIHRPRAERKLPNVLSKEEVKQIITAPTNIKHRTMLSLIYSCGLRCGELLALQPHHIDSKRNIVLLKNSKGKKDRIAPLSPKILELLREYYKMYKPKVYLFEGQEVGTSYSDKSLQSVLKQALHKVGIKKPVTLHWLRHSYATN